ncbi:MAG TPA: TVP38/TMEM64 family protein [Negativicutes bacterium]|nr:TVP38/TMEM64 family protein [Negativicutes bacterium]
MKAGWMFKLGLILLLVLVYVLVQPVNLLVNQLFLLFAAVDIQAMKDYILSFGAWAPIVSFLLMIFQSVVAPLPAFLITFANAGLFGWIKGAVLSWSSAMAGAALCFYIARLYGRAWVEKLTSKTALENVDRFFTKHGKYAILIARLLPMVSFDVVSYAAGLTSVGFWEFFVATGIGQLPATIIYSYAGEMLVGSARNLVMGLLTLFAVSVLVALLKEIRKTGKTTHTAKVRGGKEE